VLGAIEMTTGAWVYRLGRRCAADFIALLDQVLAAFPSPPAIVVICDNDSIHHARKLTAYLEKHPRLELLYGARYSPHDNPAERIWGALKNYVANTAVSWPGRLRQIHSFFRARSPDQMLATAAPWISPWLPPGYEQNFWNAALAAQSMSAQRDPTRSMRCSMVAALSRIAEINNPYVHGTRLRPDSRTSSSTTVFSRARRRLREFPIPGFRTSATAAHTRI
jgi:hypothetical protein